MLFTRPLSEQRYEGIDAERIAATVWLTGPAPNESQNRCVQRRWEIRT